MLGTFPHHMVSENNCCTKKTDGHTPDGNKPISSNLPHCMDNTMANQDINTNGPFHKAMEAQSHIGWTAVTRMAASV
jgi:hypothetical protein